MRTHINWRCMAGRVLACIVLVAFGLLGSRFVLRGGEAVDPVLRQKNKYERNPAWERLSPYQEQKLRNELRIEFNLRPRPEYLLQNPEHVPLNPGARHQLLEQFESQGKGSDGLLRLPKDPQPNRARSWLRFPSASEKGSFSQAEWTQIRTLLGSRPETAKQRVSTLGAQPALYVSSEGKESIFRRDEHGQMAEYPLTSEELTRQRDSIFQRLKPLATQGVAYLAATAQGEVLLIDSERSHPTVIADPHTGLKEGIEKWLSERSDDKPPALITVRETTEDSLEVKRLNDSLRVLEDQGKLRRYDDDDPELAQRNFNAQKPITSRKDVAVYADSVIKDAHILDGLKSSLTICEPPQTIAAGNLIIVTGHKDMNLVHYLLGLADSGLLKGKTVLLASCGDSGDAEVCHSLIKWGGATLLLRMNRTIDSAAVRNVLLKFADALDQLPDGGLDLDLLWRQAEEAAEDEAVSDADRERIRAVLDFTRQISFFFQSRKEAEAA